MTEQTTFQRNQDLWCSTKSWPSTVVTKSLTPIMALRSSCHTSLRAMSTLIDAGLSRHLSTVASVAAAGITVKAMPRKKKKFARPYQTPDDLLQQAEVQTLLKKSNLNPQMELDKSDRIAVLAHFSSTLNEPLPSNVLSDLRTAEDITRWFSKQLRPVGARPHARKLIVKTLKAPSTGNSDSAQERGSTEEDDSSLDEEIDLSREAIQERLMQRLPKNLVLDDKTFMKPYPDGLPVKNLRAKGVRPWRKVGEYAWPPRNQPHQDT